MKFSDLAKYKTGTELVVSARHDKWMESNSNPKYTDRAIAHAKQELEAQARPRNRQGTLSGSSLASCARKQQFTFLGLPELPPSPKTAAIFQTGTFMHIRWQMAGLTEGWLLSAENPVPKNAWDLSGTMDGIAYDASVVEFKSCNSNNFRRVNSFGPLPGHEYQGGTYALTTGADKVVFIYEDKDTQEYKEIVRRAEELPLQEIADHAADMWNWIRAKVLQPVLPDCWDGKGYQFTGCPFRDRCLKINSWEEAQSYANQEE